MKFLKNIKIGLLFFFCNLVLASVSQAGSWGNGAYDSPVLGSKTTSSGGKAPVYVKSAAGGTYAVGQHPLASTGGYQKMGYGSYSAMSNGSSGGSSSFIPSGGLSGLKGVVDSGNVKKAVFNSAGDVGTTLYNKLPSVGGVNLASLGGSANAVYNKLPGIPGGINIPGVGDYASLGKKLYNQIPGSADFGSMVDSEYLQELAEINSEIDKGIAQAMGAVNEAKTAALTAVNDAKAAAMKQAQQAYESAYTAAKEEAESVAASLAGEFPGIDATEFIDDGIDEMNITPADFDVTKLKLPTIDPMKIAQAKIEAAKKMAMNEAMGYVNGVKNKAMDYAKGAVTSVGKSAVSSVKSSIGF